MRHVWDKEMPMTFDEIGAEMGISGVAAQRIYRAAMKKLLRRKRNFYKLQQMVAFRERELGGRKGTWRQWEDWA